MTKQQWTKANQGTVIVEPDNGGFLVMTPDGEIKGASTKERAEAIAKCWFKNHLKSDIGIGHIEWR